MKQSLSIASVTIAYNGAEVLPRQLDALYNQSHRLDEVVVVNNASSDRTLHMLATDYANVTVLNQTENRGVGGGYAAGLQYAVQNRKHDWVWLLDQDSVPAKDSLERLIGGLKELGNRADNTAILAPVCFNAMSEIAYSASLWRNGLRRLKSDTQGSTHFVDSVISSGSLLRREPVEQVGLPRADFFMDFVDHEYCLRLRRYGYDIAVVPSSRVEHTLGDTVQTRFFGITKNWPAHAPWREYYMARNEIFTVWKYFPHWKTKMNSGVRLIRHALGMLIFGQKKVECLSMMCRGIVDGRAGRLGIRQFNR